MSWKEIAAESLLGILRTLSTIKPKDLIRVLLCSKYLEKCSQLVVFYKYTVLPLDRLTDVEHFSCCKLWVLGPPPLVSRSMLCLKVSVDFFLSNPFYHPTDTMGVVTYMTSQSMTVGHGIHPTSCRRKRTGLRRCAMRSGTWLCTLTCWKRKQDKVGRVAGSDTGQYLWHFCD